MPISLRAARASDAQGIRDLTTQLGYELEVSTVAARLSRIGSRSDQQFMVAELDGHLGGWVHVTISECLESDPCVVIVGVVVDRNCRRKGIGRLLVEEAEQWAKKHGYSIVRLWSSSARTAAHQFYEALGYTNIKTQYAFIKSLNPARQEDLRKFVPRVDE